MGSKSPQGEGQFWGKGAVHCNVGLYAVSCAKTGTDIKTSNFKNSKMADDRNLDKSSAVAEMGDRGHNRHGPKRGGALCLFRR